MKFDDIEKPIHLEFVDLYKSKNNLFLDSVKPVVSDFISIEEMKDYIWKTFPMKTGFDVYALIKDEFFLNDRFRKVLCCKNGKLIL